jgi:hypothetical protein
MLFDAEGLPRNPYGTGGGSHTARASESPAWKDGRPRRAVSPHHETLPVSTAANIYPPPRHLETTTMLEAGPLAFSEVAGSDLSMMLDSKFREHPFHALR